MMVLRGALRNIIRPLFSQRIMPIALPRAHGMASPLPIVNFANRDRLAIFDPLWSRYLGACFSTSVVGLIRNNLTDTRFPKRRPGMKSRRKRASLKPPGPYAWVQYVPGEPIPSSRPNEGSVQGRKRRKRVAQRKAFMLSEKKKRKSQYVEFKKKRDMQRIERKMAAVAREKAWAERLIELQQMEAEKQTSLA